MSILNLLPPRVRFVNPDGTLTAEAVRMLSVLVDRVGGALGDVGSDVFAPVEASAADSLMIIQTVLAEAAPPEMLIQSVPQDAGSPDIVQQPLEYSAGTGLTLSNMRFSLKDTEVVAATYGAADKVAQFTVDAQGRLTFAQDVAIAIPHTQVSGLGSMATENTGTNFSGSFTGKTVTVSNGIITSVV